VKRLFLTGLFVFLSNAPAHEIQLSPNLGWSSYSGYLLGLDGAYLVPLSQRWQGKFSGGFIARTKTDYVNFSLQAGAVYNFNDDWSHAFFAGGGVGYGNQHHLGPWGDHDNRDFYGYAEFGKRLTLNKSGTFTWVPNATLRSRSLELAEISISPLNFAYSF